VGRSKVNLIGVECPLSEGSEDRWDGRGGLGEVFEKAYQDAKGRGVNVSQLEGNAGTVGGAVSNLAPRFRRSERC